MIVYQSHITLKNGESITVRANRTLTYRKHRCFVIEHGDRFYLTLFLRNKDIDSIDAEGEYQFEDFPISYDPYWFEAIRYKGVKIWYYHELDHVKNSKMFVAFNGAIKNQWLVTNDHFEHDMLIHHRVDLKSGRKLIEKFQQQNFVKELKRINDE